MQEAVCLNIVFAQDSTYINTHKRISVFQNKQSPASHTSTCPITDMLLIFNGFYHFPSLHIEKDFLTDLRLSQLITPLSLTEDEESYMIHAVDIRDEPKAGFRVIHLYIFPESKRHTIEKAIYLSELFHLTHLVLKSSDTFP